jgi:CRP-like cAMP-binding protein
MEFTRKLKPEQLEKLGALSGEATFAEGDLIFREGDRGNIVYLIQEGQVALDIHVPTCGPTTILTLRAGQFLGWSSLFGDHSKQATARAMTATRAITISVPELLAACEADPELGYVIIFQVAESMGRRVKATRLQLLDMLAPGCRD